jgi:hypothetical protein
MAIDDFYGRVHLIETINAAVALGDDAATVQALRSGLCRMMRERSVELPPCVLQPVDSHYARRELYNSPQHGYDVIAMTWGPGQGTPIHDHDGLWCVEGVWHGQLEITQYDLSERMGDRRQPDSASRVPHHPQCQRHRNRGFTAHLQAFDDLLRDLRIDRRWLAYAYQQAIEVRPRCVGGVGSQQPA